jgi:tetratricopeptide (TPR) repeat protein
VVPDDLRDLAVDIALAADKSPAVLEKAAEYLMNCDLRQEAGTVFEKLFHFHSAVGNTEEVERIKARMESIGFVPAPPPDTDQQEKLETVESHRSGAEGFGEGSADSALSSSLPPHIRGGRDDDVAGNFGVVDIGAPNDAGADVSNEADAGAPNDAGTTAPDDEEQQNSDGVEATDEPEDKPSAPREYEIDPASEAPPSMEQTDAEPVVDDESGGEAEEYVIPDDAPGASGFESIIDSEEGSEEKIFEGLATEVTADVDEDDYRSHYDLGMAYVEMGLFDEAIREFQFASNSTPFQVRSLEMIGRCFIKQDKPLLAIRQLTRGLSLVGAGDKDALGIKYNLGVAYEMVGDGDKAQSFFEDVYVVDVTFRDIEEKVKKYAT